MAKAKNELMTLEQEAYLGELQRHRDRLAELKTMGAKLRMFEKFRPAIAAAGIVLRANELTAPGRDLWIGVGWSPARNAALLRVLLAQGMRETCRAERIDCSLVTLRHGHLTVHLPVDAAAEQKAVQA